MFMDGRKASDVMPITKQQKILISTEVTRGLVVILKNAATNGQLRGRERRLASFYVDLLEKSTAAKEGKARVGVSLHMVANTLRIILLVMRPDPIIRALVEFMMHTL